MLLYFISANLPPSVS